MFEAIIAAPLSLTVLLVAIAITSAPVIPIAATPTLTTGLLTTGLLATGLLTARLLSATVTAAALAAATLTGFRTIHAHAHTHGPCAHSEKTFAALIEDRNILHIVHFHTEFVEGFLDRFLPGFRL